MARPSRRPSRTRRERRSRPWSLPSWKPRPPSRRSHGPAARRASRVSRVRSHGGRCRRRSNPSLPRSSGCIPWATTTSRRPPNLAAASSANRSTKSPTPSPLWGGAEPAEGRPRLVGEGQVTPTSDTLPASLFLRSLQLLGFKTFARQTEIQFDGGVTAIVGPNGSGKTNIVDAVKWVLGSGQARDIRGRKMEEVIYVGGERRSRASFAEVTIKRRVERDGESDYFLNGTRVRRRDLIHLLASTGLTVDSYAIIDQHDIEHIVVCSPGERRQLLEEAAQVRGVKTRRQEAVAKLQELAANLLRLEDLKSELAPRLETLRGQAAAAREAAEAGARLELLRGSIVWEEWREARDAHRRASTQAQGLERRLIEAREQAKIAEEAFRVERAAMQSAQDRRLARQRTLGQLRLQLSDAEHRFQLGEERAANRRAVAEAARLSDTESRALLDAASALRRQLADELAQAERSIASPADVEPAPAEPDPAPVRDARRTAEDTRRAAVVAASSLASVRTRREFLEEQAERAAKAGTAAALLADAEAELRQAETRTRSAEDAAATLARLRAELDGIEALRPASPPGLRVGDIVTAAPGFEAALAAVLGPLVDATAAPDEEAAWRAITGRERQTTAVFPVESPPARAGSLYEHVHVREGYEIIVRRLLGGVVVGREVTRDGVFRASGMQRARAATRTGR